ncbi:MAG: hypothetical protein ACYC3L_12575 [Gemmatimonadaceae bacterium]
MFRAILYTQWKWARPVLVLAAIIAGWIPLQALRSAPYKTMGTYHIPSLYSSILSASLLYQYLALAVAIVIAISAWQADTARQHVYALALPVARWRFVLMRFGAGAVLLGGVAAAVGVFGAVAAAMAPLPPVLHAYPLGLAIRFWLGTLIPFGAIFALLTSNPRKVKWVTAAVVTLFAVDLLLSSLGVTQASLTRVLFEKLYETGGPLTAFLTRWMLIDV